MKRYILIAGVLAATAGASLSLAAMGTSQFGLPQGWTPTPAQGYDTGATLISGDTASAMCVECHSVNPSSHMLQVSITGSNPAGVTAANAATQGSHFVKNRYQTGAGHSGGGFTGGFGSNFRTGGQYLHGGVWTNGGVDTSSKYNVAGSWATAVETAGGFAVATAEMICESCHNVVGNAVGADHTGAADNDLLVGAYQDNVTDTICVGCHGNAGAKTTRTSFHLNGNLPPFAGAAGATVGPEASDGRKRHHVLTGDTLTDTFYRNGANSTMWAPSASNRLSGVWCTTPYSTAPGTVTNLDLAAASGVPISFRGTCNVAGQGARLPADVNGNGDIRVTDPNINCSNCHRPHNAQTSAGGFILRKGMATLPDYAGQSGSWAGTGTAIPEYGIRRQFDVAASYSPKIYMDYRPLCAGCHFGY